MPESQFMSMPEHRKHSNSDGLFGWFTASKQPGEVCPIPSLSFADCGILTDASGAGLQQKTAGITSSDSVFALSQGGIAAIAGSPRWRDPGIAEEAANNGHAAALASAWSQYGKGLLEQVAGPFTFAIADTAAGTLLAGIDRLGLHTLYYDLESTRLIFGSTATAVLAQREKSPKLTEQGIYDYVYFHMIPSPSSIYAGLRKLPTAHCLECSGGTFKTFRYWSPSFNRKPRRNFESSSKELQRKLYSAVERSATEAGKVGTFLSGGLDSSTVTGMLAKLEGPKHPAYAIGFDQDGYDEMEFARITARHFDVPLREYYVTPQDVLEELPTIAQSYDEPFGNSSALPAYFVGKCAREDGIDCLLAGDGGDEIFAGNARYAKQKVFSLYGKLPESLRSRLLEPAIDLLPESTSLGGKARSYIRQAEIPLPDRLQTYNYLHLISPSDIFSTDFLARVNIEGPITQQREIYNSLENATDLSRMLYLDWQYTLADNDLRKVSRMCAVAGVGVRYPMLDEELVQFSCEIPDSWKLKGGDLRHFFKQSLAGWLPDTTIRKKKQGFGLPFGHWMQSYKPLNELANDSLLRLGRRDFLKAEFLNTLVKLHREEHSAFYGELIWVLTVFELWLEAQPGTVNSNFI